MIDLRIKTINTVYVDHLKSRALKNYYLSNYIQQVASFSYPISVKLDKWLKINMNYKFSNVEEYNYFFQAMDENDINNIFNRFPELYPRKLVFLMNYDNYEFNKPSYTELISINEEKRYIELMLYNQIRDRVVF
jgi:hypothetical protein